VLRAHSLLPLRHLSYSRQFLTKSTSTFRTFPKDTGKVCRYRHVCKRRVTYLVSRLCTWEHFYWKRWCSIGQRSNILAEDPSIEDNFRPIGIIGTLGYTRGYWCRTRYTIEPVLPTSKERQCGKCRQYQQRWQSHLMLLRGAAELLWEHIYEKLSTSH
jgi:hypothetical protein